MESDFRKIEEKLDTLIKLASILTSEAREGLGEKAEILTRAGLAPKEIAEILGTTANTISVSLSKMKKKK